MTPAIPRDAQEGATRFIVIMMITIFYCSPIGYGYSRFPSNIGWFSPVAVSFFSIYMGVQDGWPPALSFYFHFGLSFFLPV